MSWVVLEEQEPREEKRREEKRRYSLACGKTK
jgi:hypothetical protein